MSEKCLFSEKSREGALLSLRIVRENACEYSKPKKIKSPADAAELFEKVFGLSEYAEESLCMITLDTAHSPCGFWKVSTGSLNESMVHPREVFKRALLANSYAVVLAHNHPSGNTDFSPQDRSCAQRLSKAGEVLGIKLIDFLAIGEGGSFQSASEQGILKRD